MDNDKFTFLAGGECSAVLPVYGRGGEGVERVVLRGDIILASGYKPKCHGVRRVWRPGLDQQHTGCW